MASKAAGNCNNNHVSEFMTREGNKDASVISVTKDVIHYVDNVANEFELEFDTFTGFVGDVTDEFLKEVSKVGDKFRKVFTSNETDIKDKDKSFTDNITGFFTPWKKDS